MQLSEDLINAIDRVSNRKGVVLLVIATLLFGIGPMIVLVANPTLYIAVPVSKLLLLAVGLTLPPLAVASALYLGFRRHEALDSRAVQGIVVSACTLTTMQGLGLIASWALEVPGFANHVWVSMGTVLLIGFVSWSEQRDWLRQIDAGHFVFDEGDVKEFAQAHREQFESWVRAQQALRVAEMRRDRVPKRRRRQDDNKPI